MARVKISEYQAKSLVSSSFKEKLTSLPVTKETSAQEIESFFDKEALVVKVDQGIKKRGKNGLIGIKLSSPEVVKFIKEISLKGFSNFIVEPFLPHSPEEESYISLERVREGTKVLFCPKGGIDIEEHLDEMLEGIVNENKDIDKIIKNAAIKNFLIELIKIFEENYFSFLEINPIVVKDGKVHLLDMAVEVDDAALNLIPADIKPIEEVSVSKSEQQIKKLDQNTPASLKFKLINPDGAIWLLLSGGGASIVLADEIADIGLGDKLANHGEYSGNPTREDTYMYSKIVIEEMLRSKAPNKILIIGGGVANFTDVAKTFAGIIDAMEEFKTELKKQGIKTYVRRGGPNQEKGLKIMKDFLEKNGILGLVSGPDMLLTDIVHKAVKEIK